MQHKSDLVQRLIGFQIRADGAYNLYFSTFKLSNKIFTGVLFSFKYTHGAERMSVVAFVEATEEYHAQTPAYQKFTVYEIGHRHKMPKWEDWNYFETVTCQKYIPLSQR